MIRDVVTMSSNVKQSSNGNTQPQELPNVAAPLNDQQISQLQQASSNLSSNQLAWVSGYFWGLSQAQAPTQLTPVASAVNTATASVPAGKLSIIFASQTGNAKGVAEELKEEASTLGIDVELFDASDYKGKN
ncbi:flavodoxin domain-containing protein, partial [Vibrio alfacsensis]